MIFHFDIGEKIHNITQPALVQFRAGKVLRQDAFQTDVFLFNQNHGIVNGSANVRSMSSFRDLHPASLCRNEKDIAGSIFVTILGKIRIFFHQFIVTCVKLVRDIFQKDKPKNDLFIFSSVHIPAQNTSGIPDLFLKTNICSVF